MSRPNKIEEWLLEAIQLMVQDGLSLKQAAMELEKEVSSKECEVILRRPSFIRLLWEARYRYFNQVASDPNFKKESTIGKLLNLAEKLEAEGKHRDAADAVFKAAKIAGFVGVETQVSVFGELSAKDLEAIRQKVSEQKEEKIN
jgi:hypothetical protein